MIIDNNLTFLNGTDAAVTTSPAVAIGQADLSGDAKGLGAYNNLILCVSAAEAKTGSITVTLEHSSNKDSGFETLMTYPAVSNPKAGDTLVKARLPWECRNWLRVKLSTAMAVNAFLVLDATKDYPEGVLP